ncbi:hypothetical protein FA95DRAFT_1500605 [Auriscalpium vulgare]|uniref:Uncharacterized protein n=1 Tax=Auriscalpium vulgare TaxID=40419 RepID=A0ACB8RCW0_9AGAM|nr:hypothetical protein FA95DRAFT_1500605 [Auriscalpium vulgare]
MARRAAPPHSGPAYYTPAQIPGRGAPLDETAWGRFVREQIFAPEKLPGNISIVVGVSMFMSGIAIVRRWGELLVPA